jgi:membrane-associated phospholipid phosphatase
VALSVPRQRPCLRGWPGRRVRVAAGGLTALALAALFLALLADALARPRASFDLPLLRAVQSVELLGLALLLWPVNALTSQAGAVLAWGVTLLALAVLRWWSSLAVTILLPLASIADNYVGDVLAPRARPALAEVERIAGGTDPTSFPSGHVLGAVLLYGLLSVFAGRVRRPGVRRAMRAACLLVIVSVGPARLWSGAHWPSDVLAGYALGGVLLLGLAWLYGWLRGPRGGWRLLRLAWRARRLTRPTRWDRALPFH